MDEFYSLQLNGRWLSVRIKDVYSDGRVRAKSKQGYHELTAEEQGAIFREVAPKILQVSGKSRLVDGVYELTEHTVNTLPTWVKHKDSGENLELCSDNSGAWSVGVLGRHGEYYVKSMPHSGRWPHRMHHWGIKDGGDLDVLEAVSVLKGAFEPRSKAFYIGEEVKTESGDILRTGTLVTVVEHREHDERVRVKFPCQVQEKRLNSCDLSLASRGNFEEGTQVFYIGQERMSSVDAIVLTPGWSGSVETCDGVDVLVKFACFPNGFRVKASDLSTSQIEYQQGDQVMYMGPERGALKTLDAGIVHGWDRVGNVHVVFQSARVQLSGADIATPPSRRLLEDIAGIQHP